MSSDEAGEYHRLRQARQQGDGQRAHQMREEAFSAFLFQAIGSKHVLPTAVKHPVLYNSPLWLLSPGEDT